jgi:hypothetical protein
MSTLIILPTSRDHHLASPAASRGLDPTLWRLLVE